jgi:hypothetical protein
MVKTRTSFKPGQSGNPNGAPKLPPEVKEIRLLTSQKITEMISKFIAATPEEIKAIATSPAATVLEIYIAKILMKGSNDGDTHRLDFLFNRVVGPVRQKIDHSSEDGSMSPTKTDLSKLSDEDIERLKQIQDKLK